jgi:MOSC domain-containing protein YiiM
MYPRGETVFNRRQLTVVGEEELTAVAQRLGLRELRPEWIGANLVLRGDPDLTLLPAGARLLFAGGVGLLSLGENLPCTKSGAAVAAASGRPEVASLFAREAVGRRGLICIVERAGVIRAGEVVELYPPRPTRRPW